MRRAGRDRREEAGIYHFAKPPTGSLALDPRSAQAHYRRDIDGLRAIAVLFVLFYHATPALLPGGFVGVDIFFVLSGYLISRNLFESLAAGRLSLADFYARRIRRIFPALAIVLASTLGLGWFLLLADEYQNLGASIAAGAAFGSNFLLERQASYFSSSALFDPLLHLWSLGIEEQFYIVWPFVLILCWRFRLSLLPIIIGLAAVSFASNMASVEVHPLDAFYLPQNCGWELLAGAALACLSLRTNRSMALDAISGSDLRSAASALGLVLVAMAALTSTAASYPGWQALLPVAGATLLIGAGPQAVVNRWLFSRAPLVGVGLISYPLYLWHWPLLAFLRIVKADLPTQSERLSMVGLAAVLAWISYALVERPIRRGSKGAAASVALACTLIGLGGIGLATYANGGWDGHGYRTADKSAFTAFFSESSSAPGGALVNIDIEYNSQCDFFQNVRTRAPKSSISPSCTTRDPLKAHALFIWGDSHAKMLYPGLASQLPGDWQVLTVTASACHPSLDIVGDPASDYCARANAFALQEIARLKPDVVLVAQASDHDYAQMLATRDRLRALGAKAVLTPGPAPRWNAKLPSIILRRLWGRDATRTSEGVNLATREANRRLKAAFEASNEPGFVDVYGYFCDPQGCLTRIGPGQMDLTSFDLSHLTANASRALARDLLARAVVEAADGR